MLGHEFLSSCSLDAQRCRWIFSCAKGLCMPPSSLHHMLNSEPHQDPWEMHMKRLRLESHSCLLHLMPIYQSCFSDPENLLPEHHSGKLFSHTHGEIMGEHRKNFNGASHL